MIHRTDEKLLLNPQVDSPPFSAAVAADDLSTAMPEIPGPPAIGFKEHKQ